MKIFQFLPLCLLLFACGTEPSDATTAPVGEPETPVRTDYTNFSFDQAIKLPDGFGAAVVADGIGKRARHLAIRDNGDLYIQMNRATENGNTIVALRDTDGDGKADQREEFNDQTGTGMRIHDGHLYCSSDVAVYRYPLTDALLPDPAGRTLIAGGFIEQQEHASKNFTFDNAGNLYVNVGAPSNACMIEHRTAGSAGMDPCPQLDRQAGIWKFSATQAAQTQERDGQRYATGIRNALALDWNEATNSLFALQHGRDQLHSFWEGMYTTEENAKSPAEEFLSISEGDDFGWPYCYFDTQLDQKTLAPEYGGDKQQAGRCAGKSQPILTFPAHMAPNDLMFYTGDQFPERYRNGAFIAFHGSWNRAPEPQKGYFVVFVPMKDGQPSGDWEIFADQFAGSGTIASPGDAQHRPMGLAQGPDGSLYVTDSVEGKVWRIVYGV